MWGEVVLSADLSSLSFDCVDVCLGPVWVGTDSERLFQVSFHCIGRVQLMSRSLSFLSKLCFCGGGAVLAVLLWCLALDLASAWLGVVQILVGSGGLILESSECQCVG